MTEVTSLLPLAAVAVPAIAALLVLASRAHPNVREGWTLLAGLGTVAVVALLVADGVTHVTPLGSLAGLDLALRADAAGLLFALLASTLWVATSLYSIGYMRGLDEARQTRYFAAFAASIAATMGVALAADLLTLFVFYELLTLATYPLVVHAGDAAARRAGRKYLAYTLGGGVLALAGILLVQVLAGTLTFLPGGIAGLAAADPTLARAAFGLLVAGFGVKAAVVPLHAWLPAAMVAPTPVSGLLHAVAVVKSGAFAVYRSVLYVFGPEAASDLGVALPLAVVAAATMVLAGLVGLRQDNLKRGLAYSTISQLSYIVLGIALLTPLAAFGALLHVVAHAFMKITLFFGAGVIYAETGEKYVSDIAGVGRRLPVTMTAFAIGAAGLVGFPLVAGFVSKFHLVLGAAAAPSQVFVAAFLVAGLLKLLYFWPIVYVAFFGRSDGADPASRHAFAPPHDATGTASASRTPVVPVAADGSGPHLAVDDGTADSTRESEHDAAEAAETDSANRWERPAGLEASVFLLVPVVFTVGTAVFLGVAPTALPFWELAETAVTEVFG
ncbi:proton-conducting transporter membrane subunit [Haloarcula onubensis]|uniref:Cation:proton antiporter n=1 Tax=Haloarcula onubensis TaxID=2950539 RepID=A0ABU2FR83_9EURY|nr:proton-conducting transporter membrane subunit [Halomicroarcula sp. S3CR25-11]MDS0282666.1 cation:proton antiporter [Halomicroarcula sp. S3CR25-11]